MFDLLTYSFERGQQILAERSAKHRKQNGQFLTPVAVARFMAQQLGPIRSGDRILGPAIGSDVLACAIIERAMTEGQPQEFWLDGYEIDPDLCRLTREVLDIAIRHAADQGITVHTCIYTDSKSNSDLNNR